MTDLRTQDEIMSSWKGDIREPLVTVRCMTYNHEPYIEDAIKGFLIQETNFPFQVLIHDDASTDNTAAIVKKYEKEYPLIIKGWYQQKNTYRLPQEKKKALRKPFYDMFIAKYQALCEGDDYWIDPGKLQMQVDFLEQNQDYGMCYTKVDRYDQETGLFLNPQFGILVNSYKDLVPRGIKIPTLSVCLREELYDQYLAEIEPQKRTWLLGDLPLWIFCLEKTRIHFFDTTTGVYRKLKNSACHFTDREKQEKFDHSIYDVWFYFSDKYGYTIPLNLWRSKITKRDIIKSYNNPSIPFKFRIVRFFASFNFLFFIFLVIMKCKNRIAKYL